MFPALADEPGLRRRRTSIWVWIAIGVSAALHLALLAWLSTRRPDEPLPRFVPEWIIPVTIVPRQVPPPPPPPPPRRDDRPEGGSPPVKRGERTTRIHEVTPVIPPPTVSPFPPPPALAPVDDTPSTAAGNQGRAAEGAGRTDGSGSGSGTGSGSGAGAGGGPVMRGADWVRKPAPSMMARYFPDRARREQVGGMVMLNCIITSNNRARNCQVVSEDPAGFGFGAAAVRYSREFDIRPPTIDGRSIPNARVNVPVEFTLAGGPPPAETEPAAAKEGS